MSKIDRSLSGFKQQCEDFVASAATPMRDGELQAGIRLLQVGFQDMAGTRWEVYEASLALQVTVQESARLQGVPVLTLPVLRGRAAAEHPTPTVSTPAPSPGSPQGTQSSAAIPRILRERAFSPEEMIIRGATGRMSAGYERYIPVDELVFRPDALYSTSGKGPLEVSFNFETEKYTIRAGANQAKAAMEQGCQYVVAFVEPSNRFGVETPGDYALTVSPETATPAPEVKFRSYWNDPEDVAKELHARLEGSALTRQAIDALWKESGPDDWVTRLWVKPDYDSIEAHYAQLVSRAHSRPLRPR